MYKHDKWGQIHSEIINLKRKQTSLNEVDPMFHQSNQKVTIDSIVHSLSTKCSQIHQK